MYPNRHLDSLRKVSGNYFSSTHDHLYLEYEKSDIDGYEGIMLPII